MAILGGIKGSRPRGKFKIIKLVRFTNFLVELCVSIFYNCFIVPRVCCGNFAYLV